LASRFEDAEASVSSVRSLLLLLLRRRWQQQLME
jgi:hypothetical protein